MLAFTSRFLIAALALAPGAIAAGAFKKLDKNNAALLIVDHQVGLFHLVQDMNKHEFANNVIAHAALGPIFDLPTVLTTSAETGKYLRDIIFFSYCSQWIQLTYLDL